MAGWVAPFPGRALGGRSRRFIHATCLIGWGRRGLGSCRSTCIAHRSSCCRLCGTWTVHDCTTASRTTQTRGGTRKRTRRDRGASSESCLFRVRSVDSLVSLALTLTLRHTLLSSYLFSIPYSSPIDHVFLSFLLSTSIIPSRTKQGRTSQ